MVRIKSFGALREVFLPRLGGAPTNLALDHALSSAAGASRDSVKRFRQKQKDRGKLVRREVSGLLSDFDGQNQ